MAVSASAFDDVDRESIAVRTFKFALVLGLHFMLAAWVLHAQFSVPSDPVPVRMDVHAIEMLPQTAQEIPKPVSPKHVAPQLPVPQAAARPVVQRTIPVAQPAADPAPASFAVAPQMGAPAKEETSSKPAPAAVTAARFDADYLQNPAPVFPPMSRKQHEEGKVLLLVQVSAKGDADNVQIKQTCGFARLDEAAMNAVRKWRFIPARRGNEAIAASVVVPIVFRLDS